ncbi:MAG: TolC family protein [Deltaproteobacteria bacterium]|nr:TolC family protein [Deltaproteobacteria bacterium]
MHRFREKSFGMYCILIMFIIFFTLNASSAFSDDQRAKTPQDAELKKLTLSDCVMLALQNNVAIRNAYLDRISQRMFLRVAEDKFMPQPSLTFSTKTTSTYNVDDTRTQASTQDGKFMATLTIPTGGTFNFTWDNPATKADVGTDYRYSSGWNVTFTQPILKNAGIDVATQSVRQARVAEEQYVLDLRDTLANTITTTISNYRDYVSALRNYEIQVKGLETAKQTLEVNKALIDAGRMASTEIIQAQNDVANRELSVITAKNSIESTLLTLLQTLDLDKNTRFLPVEETEKKVTFPPLNEAVSIALKNRSDYIKAVQNRELAELDLAVKKRSLLWDLSLVTGAGRTGTGDTYRRALSDQQVGKSDWNVGLALNIPLRDLATESTYVSAKVALEKANLNLKKLIADIEIDVHNKLRDVDVNYRSYILARQGRELSERKLSIEQEKLRLGRTTNFQVVSFQNDVRNQRTAELQALMTYFNSLTALDQSLGVTLDRWNVAVKREDNEVKLPEEVKKSVTQKQTGR